MKNRYNLASCEAKKVIDEGKLGKILGARAFITWYRKEEYYKDSNWKGTWDKEGGGVLIDQAIHTIDLMQWLIGDIDWVKGNIANHFHPYIEVEDVAEALIQFKNGARGLLYATNFYSYDADIILEIHGENGKIFIEKDKARIKIGDEIYTVEESQEVKEGKSYWGSSHATQIADFYNDVKNAKPHWIGPKEAKASLDIVLAIYKSKGQEIKLPLE
ncbi:MAG: Gfo/Idh/MocA family oxidoreductase [Firmicutes bacterium]|nr:Gfo/Idh/MocA family oxidoreductase [Bacillota bacterium]